MVCAILTDFRNTGYFQMSYQCDGFADISENRKWNYAHIDVGTFFLVNVGSYSGHTDCRWWGATEVFKGKHLALKYCCVLLLWWAFFIFLMKKLSVMT